MSTLGRVTTDDGLESSEFAMTEDDYAQAKAVADRMALGEVKALMEDVLKMHDNDPNFPMAIIEKIRQFLGSCTPATKGC